MPRRQKSRTRHQYDDARRVEDASRKRRRTCDDTTVTSWAHQASELESQAAQARRQRTAETKRRNDINQASLRSHKDADMLCTSLVDSDRAAFYEKIDEPLTLVCGSCGTLNGVSSSRWRDMDYGAAYFSPLVSASAEDAPRGVYSAAIVANDASGGERVSVCDRCDLALKKNEIPKYSVASGFVIAPVPPQLVALNSVECRLVGLGVAFMTCYKIQGFGQDCTKGHSISYWNDACKIALSLPRPLEKSGVVRLHTRETNPSSGVFTVRPNLVGEALLWLIEHNALYKNVTISEAELEKLREAHQNVPTLTIEQETQRVVNNVNDDGTGDTVIDFEDASFELQTASTSRTESDEILAAIAEKNGGCADDAYIDGPSSVINEYTTNTLMQSCFPSLFPDGKGGFNATTFERRAHSYDLADYCAHLMRWHDRRFVMHPNFKFFCLNLIQRRQIDGLTRRMSTQRSEDPADQDMDGSYLTRAKAMLKQLKPFFRSVRGSGLYWQEVRDELMGMLGNRVLPTPYPTFFFTLSAADTIWPDLFCACDPSLTLEEAAVLPAHTRRRLLNQNPDVASRHFYRRFKAFFEHVLLGQSQPLGKIVDYFWRVEFQRRGSPHIHGLLWVEDAPDVLQHCETEEGRISLANFVNRHISASTHRQPRDCKCQTCTSNVSTPAADVLAKRPPPYNDEQATQCDISRLVERVQQHRCYDGASCRIKNGRCRFAFPKQLQDTTVIRSETGSDGTTKFEVECKRDDPYTNGFNPQVLQLWRANMDVKLVGNAYGAAEYTAAYVSKAEPDTVKFRNAIALALEKHPDGSYLSSLRRVANASIATREVSAQEALWILQRSLPMCGKSRNVLKVKTLRHAQRYYRVDMATCLHETETSLDSSPTAPRLEALEQAYANRPETAEFEAMTYRDFCEHFEPSKEKPTRTQRLKRWPMLDAGYIKERRNAQASQVTQTQNRLHESGQLLFRTLLEHIMEVSV